MINEIMTKEKTLDLSWVRSQFPSLDQDFVFMDNAGGSQALGSVVDRIQEYFLNYNVQLGASYKASDEAGRHMANTHQTLAQFINARVEEVIVGPSTTMLLRILSICMSRSWKEGDEVIVTNSDHEANVSCWMDLQEKGIVVKIWQLNPDTYELDMDDLKALMSPRTKLVAMVHASNVLGTINPIKEVADMVHEQGGLLCVDGVAYAPHRQINVKEWDVDFYVFSTYKTFGPHQAIMYGKKNLLEEIGGINHYFINDIPYKFQPGNFNFELTYSLKAIYTYLIDMHDHHYPEDTAIDEEQKLFKSYHLIAQHEESLSKRFLDFINKNPQVTVIGNRRSDKGLRVPTISFIHKEMKSSTIVDLVDPHKIGIRFGDFYAKKAIHDLGLEDKDGVVRVSMVHFNTLEEVDRLIGVLEPIL